MTTAPPAIRSLELEITGTCQAACSHCFADSGPTVAHGSMTGEDWKRVISEASELGVALVQFIGGEPTLRPDLQELLTHALRRGLAVEVFSNLMHVRREMWDVFALPGVSLGTSYYSDRADEHDRITKVRGSHRRTRDNIVTAIGRGIPVRAGIVHVLDEQRVEEAEAELRLMGVQHISIDRTRAFGRGAAGKVPDPSELCGRCTRGRAAVMPNGDLTGCVMSRAWPAGNVREQPLGAILTGSGWADIVRMVPEPVTGACGPDDSGDCDPANTPACDPSYLLPITRSPALGVSA
ncbi:radical SAM/SPASM domain-containing protein [Streptomyces sp. NPDC050535]|uniref:radical SAM/SPASM domain-containing protein n=1 Tax=Streptomyces sp. NPDC050535 TaxID=3365626 RepID=UPI00378FFD8D